jgi:hypothetical protein
MVSSVKVSTCGKGLADEAIFLCVKIRTDNQFDRMPILEEMVKKAKKGGELAHGILHSFERIQDRLLEVALLPLCDFVIKGFSLIEYWASYV